MADRHTPPTLFGALRRAVRWPELVLLGVVPVVLIGLFFLPEPTKRALAFSYVEPTPVTAVTAHFVHFHVGHLLGNVVAFVLLAASGYLFAALAGTRRFYSLVVLTYLVAFPPVLSALNLAVPREALTYGFSGINMAMAGILPLVVTVFVGQRLLTPVEVDHAPVLFFPVMGAIALFAIPRRTLTLAVAAGALILTAVYGIVILRSVGRRRPAERWGPEIRATGWVEFAAVGVFLTLAYPLFGFPPEPAGGGTVLNLYVHFLGYSLAFLVPYIALGSGLFGTD
ncbi:MAG: rhomboid family intramembrane serine protease [Halodesulfurarchaeum sp.]